MEGFDRRLLALTCQHICWNRLSQVIQLTQKASWNTQPHGLSQPQLDSWTFHSQLPIIGLVGLQTVIPIMSLNL